MINLMTIKTNNSSTPIRNTVHFINYIGDRDRGRSKKARKMLFLMAPIPSRQT